MLMNVGMIPDGMSVADIGCDHGYVSIYLVSTGKSASVIAMDVAEGPLSSARANIESAGLSDKIEVRLSDGAKKLKLTEDGRLETDCILMAGIGGHLALKIVEDSLDKFEAASFIVMQVQSDIELVRRRMYELGFDIVSEDMVLEDGKYYPVMGIKPGNSNSASRAKYEYMYGPCLIRDRHPVLKDYLEYKKDGYTKILAGMGDESNPRAIEIKQLISDIDYCLGLY